MFNKINSLMITAAALTVSGTNSINPNHIYNLEWQPPVEQSKNRKCKKDRAKNKIASASRKHNRQRRKRGLHA